MLVDVVEDHDVHRARRQRDRIGGRQDELHMPAKSLLRPLQPGLVDIQPYDVASREPKLIRDEASRAPDVQHLQATEVLAAKEVPENGQDLSGLAATPLLVEHLGLAFGVRKLQRLVRGRREAVPRLAVLTGQLLHSTGSAHLLSGLRDQPVSGLRDQPARWYQREASAVVAPADDARRRSVSAGADVTVSGQARR